MDGYEQSLCNTHDRCVFDKQCPNYLLNCAEHELPDWHEGNNVIVDANANAELAMRVKALEADVAALQRRTEVLTEQVGDLLRAYDALRRR